MEAVSEDGQRHMELELNILRELVTGIEPVDEEKYCTQSEVRLQEKSPKTQCRDQ